MIRIGFIVASICLASSGIAAANTGPNDEISVSGVGAVKFGMSLAQAAAAGVSLVLEPHAAGAICFIAHPAGQQGLSFTIRGGQIVRADMVKPANLKTVDGLSTPGGATDVPLSETSGVTLIASPEFSEGENVRRLVYEITQGSSPLFQIGSPITLLLATRFGSV